MPIILAITQFHSIGLQNSQPKLENGFDPIKEEAVYNINSAFQGHDTEKKSEEP